MFLTGGSLIFQRPCGVMRSSAFPPPGSVTSDEIMNVLNWLGRKNKGDGMRKICILKAHESFYGRLERWERPHLQQEQHNNNNYLFNNILLWSHFHWPLTDCCVLTFRLFLERIYAAVSSLDGGTNTTVSFCICLFIALFFFFLSFFLAHTLIVLRLTGYSQPAIEMSCGTWGGVACCGKLVFGILTHMHNLTCILYVCFIVVMANVCMYACLYEHNTPLVLL